MRMGVCAAAAGWAVIEAAGADFLELPLAAALEPERDRKAVLPPLLAAAAGSRIAAEAFNVLLPGDLKIVGPDADPVRQAAYLEEGLARAAAVGGAVAVLGSGGSRAVPDGWPRADARRQLVAFLRLAGERAAWHGLAVALAAWHGLAVALEPLNRRECNFVNSVGEAQSLAAEAGHPAVGVLSDLYHVTEEGQDYGETRAALSWLRHVHVAGRGRLAPAPSDHDFLRGFFAVLRAAGYAGRVSLECHWDDLAAQAGPSVAVVRRAWEAA